MGNVFRVTRFVTPKARSPALIVSHHKTKGSTEKFLSQKLDIVM